MFWAFNWLWVNYRLPLWCGPRAKIKGCAGAGTGSYCMCKTKWRSGKQRFLAKGSWLCVWLLEIWQPVSCKPPSWMKGMFRVFDLKDELCRICSLGQSALATYKESISIGDLLFCCVLFASDCFKTVWRTPPPPPPTTTTTRAIN